MKTLLCLILAFVSICTAAEEKALTPKFICATPWKFDHPVHRGVPLKLRPDGTCESTRWKGLWSQTGPREFTITIEGGQKAKLVFAEDGMSYTGTHFDGALVTGKRVGDIPPDARAKR